MTMGPVQLLVIGFDDPQFRGEILAEIERLRQDDVVRLIDMIVVKKTEDGELETFSHDRDTIETVIYHVDGR